MSKTSDCLLPIILYLVSEHIIRRAIEIAGYDLFMIPPMNLKLNL